jgi:hypothetical protein
LPRTAAPANKKRGFKPLSCHGYGSAQGFATSMWKTSICQRRNPTRSRHIAWNTYYS